MRPHSLKKPLRGALPAMAAAALLNTTIAHAEPQPSAAMMAPVQRLVAFMSTLRAGDHPGVFAAHGVCIVENFAPFLFCGAHAAAQWEAGFRAHAADLSKLTATFAQAHDFSESRSRVYFSLPTTWEGLTSGKHFEEHGAWSFVLQRAGPGRQGTAWRILGYGWGVTAYSEDP